jgi:hypothetical protein
MGLIRMFLASGTLVAVVDLSRRITIRCMFRAGGFLARAASLETGQRALGEALAEARSAANDPALADPLPALKTAIARAVQMAIRAPSNAPLVLFFGQASLHLAAYRRPIIEEPARRCATEYGFLKTPGSYAGYRWLPETLALGRNHP